MPVRRPVSLSSLRDLARPKVPARTALAVAALVVSPLAVAPMATAGADSSQPAAAPATSRGEASTNALLAAAAPAGADSVAAQTAAAARLEQCLWAQLKPVGNGWGVLVPSVWESLSTNCNLKYGDLPHRYPSHPFGDPGSAIRALQKNLNYCYGSRLTVDGKYGSNTRAVVTRVQRQHRITADGIYGPRTRSAMNWRLYHPAKRVWSTNCYSPL